MIALVKAHVWKYKSIDDSTPVSIAGNVTVLVGKNESGKTGFLEALHKALPLTAADFKFNYISDFPRKEMVRYQAQHKAEKFQKVVELTFRIAQPLAAKINNEVFGGESVVIGDSEFTRNTDYGNKTTICFAIDQVRALEALLKPLAGQDLLGAESCFGEKSLDLVVAKIEKNALTEGSLLAVFAKLWRSRAPTPESDWGWIDGYVWSTYIHPSLPKIVYFDDYKLLKGKINLPSLQQKKANKKLTNADETALGLLELAGTTLEELMSDDGYESGKAKLEAIGLDITEKIFKFWKQNLDLNIEFDVKSDGKDVEPYNSGVNLYIRIKNRRHGVTVPFDQRSKGFIWFFSFLVWFEGVQSRLETKGDLILLLDEPGLNLHALAQADFLAYIRALSEQHQIIYSTHSPFMVDGNRLEDVRIVEDKITDGTKVNGDLAGSSDESLFPLQAALGYSIAQNLFIAKKNVLVEGPADLITLNHVGMLFEQDGKQGLGDAILVPVGGLDKVVTFVALLGANKLKIVVLHDKAGIPIQKLDDLIQQKLIERKRVLDYAMFLDNGAKEADLEDLLPIGLYIEAFNETYAKELSGVLLVESELGQHPRIVERINQWLESKSISLLKDGGFNHYRVAGAILPKLTSAGIGKSCLARFERLFAKVGGALG